jgi:biotin carboxyl carrier protein
MPGLVVAVLVEEGQAVQSGEGVVILESMKMENEIRAPRTGIVTEVAVVPGQRLQQEDLLLRIVDAVGREAYPSAAGAPGESQD